ncbi:MAG: SAM-dependent chlorinase/fluorinase [Acidimicrobiales bacterium]
MGQPYDTVSLLTDLGTADELAGVLRSVVRSIAPHAVVIDITHEVPPHDVRAGSLALVRAAQYLAAGVVVGGVDPGGGTGRRAIAVEVGGGQSVLIGPDNGLLAPAVSLCGGPSRVVELLSVAHRLPAAGGPTFAARDVLVPAAAHLCNGVDLAELGPAVDPFSLLPGVVPLTRIEDDVLKAEVLWVDRFGNAQLNVDPDELKGFGDRITVTVGERTRTATRSTTFAALGPGQLGLLVDSYGLVALVLDRGSAADEIGLGPGAPVDLSAPR